MKDLILVKRMNNLYLDLTILYHKLKIYVSQLQTVGEIQKITYQLIYMLIAYINNEQRINKEKLISKFMDLQEMLLDDDENSLSRDKILQLHVCYKQILFNEISYNTGCNINHELYDKLYDVFNQITNELSVTNYLTEEEILKVLDSIVRTPKTKYIKIKRKY